MIEHLNQIGRTAASLELLSKTTHSAVVSRNKIQVTISAARMYEFDSEEDYMLWLLNRIKETVEAEIKWFETHPK